MAAKVPRRDGPTPEGNHRVLLEECQRASSIRTLACDERFTQLIIMLALFNPLSLCLFDLNGLPCLASACNC